MSTECVRAALLGQWAARAVFVQVRERHPRRHDAPPRPRPTLEPV